MRTTESNGSTDPGGDLNPIRAAKSLVKIQVPGPIAAADKDGW